MAELQAAVIPVTPFQQNCTLLWDDGSKQAWVIDPGGNVPRIREAIGTLGLAVERILLTHGHIDHAGGAAELRDALGVPLDGPDERDAFLLDGLAEQGRAYGMTEARNVRPDRWLLEGDAVTLGSHRFDVLHCPGHAPGPRVFVNRAARVARGGGVLVRGSVGRTDFPYGDPAALLESIRGKLLPLGDDVSFICGHGPGSTIAVERRANPFVAEVLG